LPPGSSSYAEDLGPQEKLSLGHGKSPQGRTIILSRPADAPPEAVRDVEGARRHGAKSLVTFPLTTGGRPTFGVLNFTATREERDWTAELLSRLQLVAQVFANANGCASYLEVLDAQRTLFAAQLNYTQNQGVLYQTLINLYKAMGGGWVTEADKLTALPYGK
jgi:GAF domain-containing protein